jgi:hypothetical protein
MSRQQSRRYKGFTLMTDRREADDTPCWTVWEH